MKKVGVELTLNLLAARVRDFLDAIEHLLIRQAVVEALLGEAGLLGDRKHRLERLLHHPVLLLRESVSISGKYLSLAGAARQHGGGGGERIERELAEDEADLAGIDVFLLHLRIGGLVEVAQCGQVIEAYSMMVTGALAAP